MELSETQGTERTKFQLLFDKRSLFSSDLVYLESLFTLHAHATKI